MTDNSILTLGYDIHAALTSIARSPTWGYTNSPRVRTCSECGT